MAELRIRRTPDPTAPIGAVGSGVSALGGGLQAVERLVAGRRRSDGHLVDAVDVGVLGSLTAVLDERVLHPVGERVRVGIIAADGASTVTTSSWTNSRPSSGYDFAMRTVSVIGLVMAAPLGV